MKNETSNLQNLRINNLKRIVAEMQQDIDSLPLADNQLFGQRLKAIEKKIRPLKITLISIELVHERGGEDHKFILA
jgi:hypothetical protein